MNKIFKVIWSKAKHCYIVASELAKSYSKGGGSRSIRRAAVALLAAAVYATAGSALAENSGGELVLDDYIGNSQSNYTVKIDSDVTGNVYGNKGNTENIEEASVTMTGGNVGLNVYGGYSFYNNAASNSVNISGGKSYAVFGGWSSSKNANDNQVTMTAGEIAYDSSGSVLKSGNIYGGYSDCEEAASNSVIISGGKINKEVYGGWSYSVAASNSVNISGGKMGYVFGGYSYANKASSNTVNISGGTIDSDVYGGHSLLEAENNCVNISGGTIDYVEGGYSYYCDVTSNSVNISNGTINHEVYGGESYLSNAASNSVNITGGTVNEYVYGGRSTEGVAASNSVTLNGGTVNNSVYGGYSETGIAASNSVNIIGGKTYAVYGGYSESGEAKDNQVTMTGGEIAFDNTFTVENSGSLYGGYSFEGYVASNSVNVSGGIVNYSVYGGFTGLDGLAASNSVRINNASINGDVCGGRAFNGSAASNTVNISGALTEIKGHVYGGYIKLGNGSASYNLVTIDDGKIGGDVYGGYAYYYNAASNSVNISGGTIGDLSNSVGNVFGGYSDYGSVASNSVNISGDSTLVNCFVYGGYVSFGNGSASSNIVSLDKGTVGSIYGGFSQSGEAASNSVKISDGKAYGVYGGRAGSGNAVDNNVTLNGGNIAYENQTEHLGYLFGGYSYSGTAASNSVTISGGTVGDNVYGGRSYSGEATSNSVNISGDTTKILGNIYGGVASYTGNAYENKVNIATGTLKIVYGGYSESGSVASNSVVISGDTTKINEVYGGYVNSGAGSASYNILNISSGTLNLAYGGYANGSGDANENQVTMTGGQIVYDNSINNSGNLYGGYSESGSVASNSVDISGDTIEINDVYGGYVNIGIGSASYNTVNINVKKVENNVYGGKSQSGESTNNSVTISGGTIEKNVYGGWSYQGVAASNSVNISNGTVNQFVHGGYSNSGDAASNSVNISSGSITAIFGGYVNSDTGSASYNIINLSDGDLDSVYGGYVHSGTGSADSNNVTISSGTMNLVYGGFVEAGEGDAVKNFVNISGGKVSSNLIGGYSYEGNVASNSVNISGDTVKILGNIYGGLASGNGYANYNQVNIATGSLKIVYGGYSESGSVASNSVSISGDTTSINEVYGGYVKQNTGSASYNLVNISSGTLNIAYGGYSESGDANENQVTMTGGKIKDDGSLPVSGNLYGGYSNSGNAASNSVNISGGNVKYDVFGGYVNQGTGSASYNLVNISGGTVNQYVYGGRCNSGYAASNSVNISDGTVNGVLGARSESSNTYSNSVNISGGTIGIALGGSSYSDSASNSVNISGGTVEDAVYGGSSDYGVAINNSVNISGNSTSIDCNVYGGYSISGSVASNSVNISGGTISFGSEIYAGYVDSSNNSSIKDNGVNISGDVTGLDNADIYGYYFRSGSGTNSGNELHIGRAVDYDDEGKIKRDTDGNIIYKDTIWQGKNSNDSVNNKIKKVTNFESIILHEVAWDNSLPALAAESFNYNDSNTDLGGNVTLDISNMTFDTELPSGVITLLQSDATDNFSNLKLKYSDSVAASTIPDSGTTVKSENNKTSQSKGIKLTYDYTQSVSLSDSNKKVNFTALNTFKKAELGSMKWSDGGYTFANTDAIDANGLVVDFSDNFKVEGAEDKNKDDSLVLLDLSTITSAETKDAIDTTTTLTYYRNPTSAASLTLSLAQTDVIKTNDAKNILTYTIGTKNVIRATFDKELVWNTSSQPFYDASSDSGYIFSESTVIDAQNLTLSFTDSQKDSLKEEDSMTLISASGISSSNNVFQPDNKTFQLSRTGAWGTKFDGTATGVVLAENSAVKYQISKIETDKLTLGSRSWTADAESLPDTWRVKADTIIDANDFSFTSKAETVLASGDTRTLVSGSEFAAGKIADKNVGIDYTVNSLKLGATALGQIETTTTAVQFKVNSVTLDSLDISGWKSTDNVSAVPDGWAANANGVDITATNFDPELTSGSKTIITATTAAFSDNKIDENIRYKADSFSNDSKNGVTFAGFQEGGVKATDGGKALTYYTMFNDVTDISFGEMNWGTIRDASAVNYDYANISNGSIDISNLTFTAPENIDAGAETTLLTANNSLGAGENISHSQDFEKAADNGAKFESTLSGTVIRTTAGEIGYKAGGKTLNGVDLSEWNSTQEASAVPDGLVANANGVNVTATNFNPALTTGSKTIITASADMFKDENIDESIRYGVNSFENDSENGVTLSGNKTGGVKSSDDGKTLTYHAMFKDVSEISLGSMKWGEGRTFNSEGYEFKNLTKIDATGLKFTNPEIMSGTMDIVANAKNLGASVALTGSSHKQNFDSTLENNAVVSATLTGVVSVEAEKVKYALDGITINKFDLANWDGEKAASVNDSWKLADSASVETDGMSNLPDSDEEKQVFILKSDTESYFENVTINGENIYGKKQNKFTDSDESQSIVLSGTQDKGITLDSAKANLVYKVGSKDVTSLKLNSVLFEDGAELLSRDKYNYSKLTTLDTKDFNISFEKPETITVNQSMTLLKANETLADMAAIEKPVTYQYEPLSGVIMDAVIRSSLEAKSGKVTLTTLSHNADKLTFGNVDWLEKGALIDHKTMLNNVSFNGTDVDTTKIAFDNKRKLDADMQMTLVSDFGDSVGTITGSKYKVGTAYEGEGSAYLDGNDLKFKIKTGAGLSDETHTTVMAMEAGTVMMNAGTEQLGRTIEGLGSSANVAPDGTATFASVGGGTSRYETGSHVDTSSWNIAMAVGKNLEKRDGTMEYGLFAEYGRGNYTLHMDGIEDAGSGSTHYTGGGLLLKWTNSHNVYTEASFRMGNMKDNASSLLHDGAGNAYGYDIKAKYRGGHIGFGKTYKEEDNTKLDIYGKYFYNEREGIDFAAGADQYSLDKVRSRVLRAGFRLSSTDRKWNRYGGLSYDYEFGGKSSGIVNGTPIRSASVKGGTLRGEFGYCREATKTNPWKTDFSLYGFTGKRRGFGGSIAVEYHF